MFISGFIKHHDTAIIQIVGNRCPFVILYHLPTIPIAPDALNHHQRLSVAFGKQFFPLVVVLDGHPGQFHLFDISRKGSLLATRLPVRLIFVGYHLVRLSPVSQPEVQPSKFLFQPVATVKFIVGIIRPVFVYHIAYKRIIGRRLYAKSPAPMHPPNPHSPAFYLIHSAKIRLSKQKNKLLFEYFLKKPRVVMTRGSLFHSASD